MSKRQVFPQQYGERKRTKLDVTVSDHNFPFSQNYEVVRDGDPVSTWSDDDDEILMLASQAYENAYNIHNSSHLPNYSMCMQPTTTSTQNDEPLPSTSKAAFTFKKPSASPLSIVTTKLRDKCERISSPLPGLAKVYRTDTINLTDDIIINDNLRKRDSDHIYKQLLELQEENVKLKSENGKLIEKCVTKEGEASILRTQLKVSQIAVDNARLEKVKVQERLQMDWTDKLAVVSNQMQDLRTQLDFKNLEIIRIKEKYKVLESNKVKLTQITLSGNDISMSQRHNNNSYKGSISSTHHIKKMKTSSAVQTETNSHFMQLNIPIREESSKLTEILPLIMTPTSDQRSVLEYNEKLRQPADGHKCRVYNTFHRLPSTPKVCEEKRRKITMECVYERLSKMAVYRGPQWTVVEFLDIFKTVQEVLQGLRCELESVSRKATTAFHKEMDERYIAATSQLLLVDKLDLLGGQPLYKEEQGILARRMTAVLVYILEDSRCDDIFDSYLHRSGSSIYSDFVNITSNVCTLLDNNACAVLYSGVLLSITFVLNKIILSSPRRTKTTVGIIQTVTRSRAMPFVVCRVLHTISRILPAKSVRDLCSNSHLGNLKLDYDQGVLLYRRDTCTLQVMLKQIEGVLKCAEREGRAEHAVYNTRNLILLYGSMNADSRGNIRRCDCQLVLIQVMTYGLYVCANMLKSNTSETDNTQTDILTVCRSGVQALYRCASGDVEFASQLGYNEGHLLEFCEKLRGFKHADICNSMLSEVASCFQPAPEDGPAARHQRAWLDSFRDFALTD